jgi:hypothetical protein
MKQLLASLLVLAMCAPAMALTFSLSDGGDGKLVIAYDLATGEGLRGLALTVTRTSGDAAVAASTDFTTAFNTFIDFAADVDNTYSAVGQGHPFALITPDVVNGQYEAAFPASSFALSMGYLAPANQLALTDDGQIVIQLTGTADSCFTVALDTLRGGAVGDNLTVNAAGLGNVCVVFAAPECIPSTNASYAQWVAVGKPDSWCNVRQCHGDANNAQEQIGKVMRYVGYADLNILVNGFNKVYTGSESWISADFSRTEEQIGKVMRRVGYNDLNILVTYFNNATVPADCNL